MVSARTQGSSRLLAALGLALMLSLSACASKGARKHCCEGLSAEQKVEMHQKMAEAHQKMAECLKSGKGADQCHEAHMKGMKHGKCPMCHAKGKRGTASCDCQGHGDGKPCACHGKDGCKCQVKGGKKAADKKGDKPAQTGAKGKK